MIRTETEYKDAVKRLNEEREQLSAQEQILREQGLSGDSLDRAMSPMRSFFQQFIEEVECYERLRRGEFEELMNFRGIGRMLIAFRIFRGISQRDLAKKLGVHESQVSRDEKNEYHGATVDRVGEVLDALGMEIRSHVQQGPPPIAQPRVSRQRAMVNTG